MSGIKQLEIFTEVVERKSFTAAAAALFMSQPAVSWQIKRLEEELSVNLLKRHDKNIELTEAGELFYNNAKVIVGLYRQSLTALTDYNEMLWGRLLLGASSVPGEYLLPKAAAAFREKHPRLTLNIFIKNSAEIIEMLAARELDLALVGCKKDEPTLEFVPLADDEIIAVAAADFDIPDIIDIGDLQHYPLIWRESRSGTSIIVESKLREVGIEPSKLPQAITIYGNMAVLSLVQAEAGIAFVSRYAAQAGLERGELRRVQIRNFEIRRPLYLVHPKTEKLSTQIAAFVAELIK